MVSVKFSYVFGRRRIQTSDPVHDPFWIFSLRYMPLCYVVINKQTTLLLCKLDVHMLVL